VSSGCAPHKSTGNVYYRNTWCVPTSEHIRVPQGTGSSDRTLAVIPVQMGVVVCTLKKLTSLIQ